MENKKRKTIVDELIKRGYKPDPVKEWKRRIAMEDDEDKDGDEAEEGDAEEGTSKKDKKPVDPEKAFKSLTDVKKYDYLLGMALWMLTDERKNELLKQRDAKLAELNILKAKTPADLWEADLNALEKKLDEVEEIERNDESGINKKTAKAMKAIAGKGGSRRSKAPSGDIYPSTSGIKVKFHVTSDMIKKVEALDRAAIKTKREPGAPAAVKKEKANTSGSGGTAEDEPDEFDVMVEGAAKTKKPDAAPKTKKEPAVKKEPKAKEPKLKAAKKDGLKQSKLNFPKVRK